MRCPIPKWLLPRKPEFKFLCRIPGATAIHPIVSMREAKPEWLRAETVVYAKRTKNITVDTAAQHKSVAKCPGIRTILDEGWLVRNWQDVVIRVEADGSYTWRSAVDQALYDGVFPYVGEHPAGSFSQSEHLRRKVPILKLHTPWMVEIPKGYALYQKGVPYQEHDMFTVGEGIFSWQYGACEINVQLMFNAPGEYFLKAGMPIAQLVPIKEERVGVVIRDATPEELAAAKRDTLAIHHMFVANYRKVQEIIATMRGTK